MCSSNGIAVMLLVLLLAGCAATGLQPADDAHNPGMTAGKPAKLPQMSEAQKHTMQVIVDVMREGEWETASELLSEQVQQYPQSPLAYANMGIVYRHLNKVEEAEQAWDKALTLQPEWAAAYNQLGMLYREQGRFDDALAMYLKALSADDRYANSHLNIAILYEIYLGKAEPALHHYRRYAELNGEAEGRVSLWIADLERRLKRGQQ